MLRFASRLCAKINSWVRFKEERLQAQLLETSSLLQEMAVQFEAICRDVAGIEPTMTRVSDPVEGESGVHLDKRAFDCRDEFAPNQFLFTPSQRDEITKKMNELYPRNDGKKTCIHHSFRGAPHHFHIQVAPNEGVYARKKDNHV